MAPPSLTSSSAPTPSLSLLPSRPLTSPTTSAVSLTASSATSTLPPTRRGLSISIAAAGLLSWTAAAARAASDEEYVKETAEVIRMVRSTIIMDKSDPNVAAAVAELREASNSWVAKYRREKSLLGRSSFRDMYSALNAVSGHYISFGPTAPIPAKRKARILEEMDTAEKALLRGR